MLKFGALSLAVAGLAVLSSSFAQEPGHSVVVDVEGPTLAPPTAEPMPVLPAPPVEHHAPVEHYAPPVEHYALAPAVKCYPIQVIREATLLSAKRAYRCYGAPIHQTLCVDNPADCCHKLFSVPVCVPACCVDQPVCVDKSVGLLGRGRVVYRWRCGFEAVITFRVHGGVLITYR